MEKAIENGLSLRDLGTVVGGADRTYTMRGDTYVCKDDGTCTNTSAPPKGSSLWTWIKAIF
jgi:hypothetical protein